MADLAALKELHAWMRATGVLYARAGDLELRLEPEAPAPREPVDAGPEDPAASAKRELEELLFSSGADPAPFLEHLRRSA